MKERSLWILFLIICVAHFSCNVHSLTFQSCACMYLFVMYWCIFITRNLRCHIFVLFEICYVVTIRCNLYDVKFTSCETLVLFICDIILTDFTVGCKHLCMSVSTMEMGIFCCWYRITYFCFNIVFAYSI